jgi:hypothetical protein
MPSLPVCRSSHSSSFQDLPVTLIEVWGCRLKPLGCFLAPKRPGCAQGSWMSKLKTKRRLVKGRFSDTKGKKHVCNFFRCVAVRKTPSPKVQIRIPVFGVARCSLLSLHSCVALCQDGAHRCLSCLAGVLGGGAWWGVGKVQVRSVRPYPNVPGPNGKLRNFVASGCRPASAPRGLLTVGMRMPSMQPIFLGPG